MNHSWRSITFIYYEGLVTRGRINDLLQLRIWHAEQVRRKRVHKIAGQNSKWKCTHAVRFTKMNRKVSLPFSLFHLYIAAISGYFRHRIAAGLPHCKVCVNADQIKTGNGERQAIVIPTLTPRQQSYPRHRISC